MPKSFKEFKQFVTDKDKGKAPVKKIADYPGPIPNAPPGGGAPYAATGKGGKATKGAKVGNDWTDKGDKKLVYKPKTDQGMTDKKGEAKCVTTVEQFLRKTKGLSSAQFAKYIAENSKNAGVVHESIHNTCQVLASNPFNTADLVRELKRSGLLEHTVVAALEHPESLKIVARMMENQQFCNRLVKEMVGPPMHHGMNPHGNPHHGMLNMGDSGMMGDPSGMPGMPQGGPGGGGMPGMGNDPNMMGDSDDQNGMGMDGDYSTMSDDEDEDLHPGMHPDDQEDTDGVGINDEDEDGMGDPTQGAANPMGGPPPHHGAGVGLHRHNASPGMDVPKPSMMARMMARENNNSLASKNFLKALKG